jgi:molecular chaperone DnaK (HSP70)
MQNKNRITNEADLVARWGKTAGAMVIKRAGKLEQSLRVIVIAVDLIEGKKVRREVELKPSMLVQTMLLYLICQCVKATNQAAQSVVCTVPGMRSFVFVLMLTPVVAAIQKFTSYMKIKRILEELGLFVPYMLAEPVAACLHWYFNCWKEQKVSIYPAELPECLRCILTMDLGGGMKHAAWFVYQ